MTNHPMTAEDARNFWTGDAAALRSYPPRYGMWADDHTPKLVRERCDGMVCEVGCGIGRAATIFAADRYVGLDINPHAISRAKAQYPDHKFEVIKHDDEYPEADTYLFMTMIMHVHDSLIESMFRRAHPHAFVVDLMDTRLRREENGAFHRTPDWYRETAIKAGFLQVEIESHPTVYRAPRRKELADLQLRYLDARA